MSLLVLWLTLSVYSAPPHIEALYEQMVADELAIKSLLERFNCSHVYFDMGANIGVQIRKLYEATLYPHAPAVRLFNATFGPAPHCDVCAIAIEPNPRHALRLAQLKENYHRAGVGVLVLIAAVSDADGVTRLTGFNRTDRWIQRHGGVELQVAASVADTFSDTQEAHGDSATVRTVDLARLVHTVDRLLVRMHGGRDAAGTKIVMKMDIEGSEHRVLPHLMHTHAMCLVNRVYMEWHGAAMRSWFMAQIAKSPCGPALSGDFRAMRNDDETYRNDGRPWPKTALCEATAEIGRQYFPS